MAEEAVKFVKESIVTFPLYTVDKRQQLPDKIALSPVSASSSGMEPVAAQTLKRSKSERASFIRTSIVGAHNTVFAWWVSSFGIC